MKSKDDMHSRDGAVDAKLDIGFVCTSQSSYRGIATTLTCRLWGGHSQIPNVVGILKTHAQVDDARGRIQLRLFGV